MQDLSGRIAEQDATYTSEVAGLRRLIEMVENRGAQSKVIVENVEQEWATVNDRVDRCEAALREQMERERSRTEAAEARVEELERVLERSTVANSLFLHLDLLYHRLLREVLRTS